MAKPTDESTPLDDKTSQTDTSASDPSPEPTVAAKAESEFLSAEELAAEELAADDGTAAQADDASDGEVDDDEIRQDVAYILVGYDDAFALEEAREKTVAFLERATTVYVRARENGFRLDGEAWDALNEEFPDVADYLLAAVERVREVNDLEEGTPDVEEILSLGFGFERPEDVEPALYQVGRYYRIELDAQDPPIHEGLPLAFWAHLGAEGAAEVRASALEERLMEFLEERQDLIEDALFALVDDGLVWELLASIDDSEILEDALFDYLEEHWPDAARQPVTTSQVDAEVVAEFTLEREDGYLYFVDADGDISRSLPSKDDGEKVSEKVVECGVEREDGWLYYVGPVGNVLRVPMYRAGSDDDED